MNTDWIDWNGGDCPVAGNARVDVKFRSGVCFNDIPAIVPRWSHMGFSGDIAAYRLAEKLDDHFIPPEPVRPLNLKAVEGKSFAVWIGEVFTMGFFLSSLYSLYTGEPEFASFMMAFACFAKLNNMDLKR